MLFVVSAVKPSAAAAEPAAAAHGARTESRVRPLHTRPASRQLHASTPILTEQDEMAGEKPSASFEPREVVLL